MSSDDAARRAILDEEHLRLLAIAYYVVAGFCGLMALFGVVYALFGVGLGMMISEMPAHPGQQPPPEFMGWFFGAIGVLVSVIGLAAAVLMFFTARFLQQRRARVFCIVCACLCCIQIPFGLALGIASLFVLTRSTVAQRFDVPARA